ncbi:MAG: Ribosome biogenesis protein [Watsoniomyces obsoletus]|nr:MAG: Ribosome biogenesis protein [Watsoniomyces obsoletus]
MDLIQRGYTDVIDDPKITAGGSTACVALVHENGRINIANLGDSGFMHLRQQHIRSRFQPQLHDFNTPYQLSLVPPELRARSEMFGGRMLIDSPSDARQYTCWVRSGDVLIFATDGLWDNFEYWEVQKLVYMEMTRRRAWVTDDEKGIGVGDALRELTEPVDSETKAGGSSLQEMLASTIVRLAKLYSAHPLKDSPFARMLRRHNPLEGYRGGKLDDICVMVVIPVETTTPAVDD